MWGRDVGFGPRVGREAGEQLGQAQGVTLVPLSSAWGLQQLPLSSCSASESWKTLKSERANTRDRIRNMGFLISSGFLQHHLTSLKPSTVGALAAHLSSYF